MKFIYPKLYKITLLFLLIISCHKTDKNTTPNVIFILTDDLGFADLSSYGSEIINTPNLDLMASQGALLSSYYATQAVCSASRASILTGSYPNRIGFSGALGPNSKKELIQMNFYCQKCLNKKATVLQFMGNGILEIIKNFYQQIMDSMIFLEYYIQMICGHITQSIQIAIQI